MMKRLLFYTLCLAILLTPWGCLDQVDRTLAEIDRVLAEAPDAGPQICYQETVSSYVSALASYKDSAEIRYYVGQTPDWFPRDSARLILRRAWDLWQNYIDVPIFETQDVRVATIQIQFLLMDGRGGHLAEAEFPPTTPSAPMPKSIKFDLYDLAGGAKGGAAAYDFFTIAAHEMGHALGLKHSDHNQAVMYWSYLGQRQGLDLDDVLGIKDIYRTNSPFYYSHHRYRWIQPGSSAAITANFTEGEALTKCRWIGQKGHWLDVTAIEALQVVRDAYGVPIVILSTYRDSECNVLAGGASQSQHLVYNAIDWAFSGSGRHRAQQRYKEDILARGSVFRSMLDHRVRGFGIYDRSNHIDTRDHGGLHCFDGVDFALWGNFYEGAIEQVENCEIINQNQL